METPSKLLHRTRSSLRNSLKEDMVGGRYQETITLIGLYTKAIASCEALERAHANELAKTEFSFNQNH